MVVVVGDTDKLAVAPLPVPTSVVYVAFEYHFQLAPVPKLPPLCVSVVLPPLQIGVVALKVVGATEG